MSCSPSIDKREVTPSEAVDVKTPVVATMSPSSGLHWKHTILQRSDGRVTTTTTTTITTIIIKHNKNKKKGESPMEQN